MKAQVFAALILATSSTFAVDLPKWDKLTLKSGREYEKVTVTEKRPDGISISHESGTARIKFEDLPEEPVKQLGGFDVEAAAEARKAADEKEAATRAEIDKGIEEQAEEQQRMDDHKATVAASRPAVLKVIQATEGGVLCRIAWFQDQKQGRSSKDSFGRSVTTYKTVPTLSGLSDDLHFVTGIRDVVDGQEISVSLVSSGNHRYTKVTGAESTVRKWKAINGGVDAAGAIPKTR